MSKRICIAKITTAHGIRGLVKLHVYADDIDLVNGMLFTDETVNNTVTVTLKNATAKHWLAEIDGVTDRNQAELLRGTMLYIDRDALPKPDEDEFYIEDLIDMAVQEYGGKTIGTVVAVENFGASDLLDIQPIAGGDSFYLPFTDETIIDIADNAVIVAIPEGLVE